MHHTILRRWRGQRSLSPTFKINLFECINILTRWGAHIPNKFNLNISQLNPVKVEKWPHQGSNLRPPAFMDRCSTTWAIRPVALWSWISYMYMSPRMDVRILCHGLCSAWADTEAYVIDSGILTILGWLVVSPSNKQLGNKNILNF